MTHENWPSQTHAYGCVCPRCRGGNHLIDRLASRSLSTALRHAQDRMESELGFEAATPAGDITLPGKFGGWQQAITLAQLFQSPPTNFTSPAPPRQGLLYRIYQHADEQHPLYIGMAYRATIQCRVADHLKGLMAKAVPPLDPQPLVPQTVMKLCKPPKTVSTNLRRSEVAKLRALISSVGLNWIIKVQYGLVTPDKGKPLDQKLLHAFEIALQVIERPHSYVGSARTFEEDWF